MDEIMQQGSKIEEREEGDPDSKRKDRTPQLHRSLFSLPQREHMTITCHFVAHLPGLDVWEVGVSK